MKGYCFLILAVAFLMYFQKEPVFTVIILTIGLGLYLFIKARKSGKGFLGFMGGNEQPQHDQMNDLMTLIILQQLFSDRDGANKRSASKPVSNDSESTRTKEEIMELFDKYDSGQKNNDQKKKEIK